MHAPFRVGHGGDLVEQLQVREAVHVHLGLEHHHHAVPPQLHGAHLALEHELADAAVLVVIPDHHLGREGEGGSVNSEV
jgi:hypothetical protein